MKNIWLYLRFLVLLAWLFLVILANTNDAFGSAGQGFGMLVALIIAVGAPFLYLMSFIYERRVKSCNLPLFAQSPFGSPCVLVFDGGWFITATGFGVLCKSLTPGSGSLGLKLIAIGFLLIILAVCIKKATNLASN